MFSSKSRGKMADYVSTLELATINEKDIVGTNRELLLQQAIVTPPRARKIKQGLGSSLAINGMLVTDTPPKRGRSHSLPFLSKIVPFNHTETALIFFDKMTTMISGLYCKMLVVLGMSFPVAEVLSKHVPTSFYETFYFYLYLGSMIFLTFVYVSMLKRRNQAKKLKAKENEKIPSSNSRYGSFHLRMGAAAFGIGSMIYAGLEFGQYFELVENVKCSNVLMAVTPALRMVFIVFQLQFIFVGDKQKTLKKYRSASRFGLMHMIATNLCVWLNVLVQETKHEIMTFYNLNTSSVAVNRIYGGLLKNHSILKPLPLTMDFNISNEWLNSEGSLKNDSILNPHPLTMDLNITSASNGWLNSTIHRVPRGLRRPQDLYECRRANIMGSLVQNAAPFLFPCTIEYSLICAVILYALWKSVGQNAEKAKAPNITNRILKPSISHTSQYFTVDCANAHKGLFASIIVIVFTIISLIMFFALIKVEEYATTAVFQVNLCELTLYVLSTLGTILAMYKIKDLRYETHRHLELDNILLVMAQTGLYMYFMFSLIAGYFTSEILRRPNIFITAIFGIIQSSFQTLFIVDAWWRRCTTTTAIREKPARQLVTFLLLSNIAMWAINHLENARADFHPIELRFYGVWAWTIITHLSMPLAVFYRFHSTVCLCEIWKGTYKMRLENFYKENDVLAV